MHQQSSNVRYSIDGFAYDRLKYDSQTNSYANLPGVQVRVPGFGDTNTVEFLDDNENEHSAYFQTLVEYFEGKGYVKGKTIRAAPYDWRLGASECYILMTIFYNR